MNDKTTRRFTLRLGVSIIVIFVTLILGTASLIGVISFHNGRSAVDALAERMLDSIESRVSQTFDFFLTLPHALNRINADAFGNGQVDIRDFPHLRQRFLSQIQAVDSVETCAFGSEAGEFISAGKRGSGKFDSALADKTLNNHYSVYLLDETGNPGEVLSTIQDYLPKPRPWYQAALAAKGPAWSPVYVWASQENIGISAVLSVRDRAGTVLGVQQSALSLARIGEFLQTVRERKSGLIFVVERSGLLIASSTPEPVVRRDPDKPDKPPARIQALESNIPLIRDIATHVKTRTDFADIAQRQRMRVNLDGKTHFLSIAPFADNRGLDWLVCIAIPESDLMGPVQSNLYATLSASMVALFGAIVLACLLTQWMTRPLEQLTESVKHMRQGKWGKTNEDIHIAEVKMLAVSFNEMAEQLRESFETLEARVQTRTNDLSGVNDHLKAEITERRQAEEALKKSESVLTAVLSATADGILAVDTDNRVLYANDRFAEMWRIPQALQDTRNDTALLRHVLEQLADPDSFLNEVRRLYQSEEESFDTLVFRDGRIFERLSRVMTLKEIVLGRVWSFRDVSERKRAEDERMELERRLMQTQKAESLARMAGAIAHHFNNLISVVMGNLEIAMISLPVDSAFRCNMVEAMNASRRAADLSGLMLAYLGQTISDRKPIVLKDVCLEPLAHIQSTLPETISIRIDMADTHSMIQGNTAQIRQLVTNLVTNAIESNGDQTGEIVVGVGVKTPTDIANMNFYPPEWKPKAMNYACIWVRDVGSGMDADTIGKVFDPFFTTGFTGRGLGLPVALGIVKSHGGAMTVESELGRGSLFCAYLPILAEAPPSSRKAESERQQTAQEPGLMLVVDDEPMVRNMTQTMLTHLGWKVLAASDGKEALKAFQEKQADIRGILLDLTMPGMDGWETLEALRRIRPNVPVILASGYDEARVMSGEHTEQPQFFLHKPYQLADLKAALSKILAHYPG